MQFTGVYTVNFLYTAMATAVTLLEVTADTETAIKLISAWISPRGAILDQIQEVNIFINDAAGTGTAITPNPQHEGFAAFGGSARRTVTAEGATPTDIIEDGFHFQNGYRHDPIPEQMITIKGGSIVGIRLPVAPDAAMGIVAGLTFGEIG